MNRREFLDRCGRCALACAGWGAGLGLGVDGPAWTPSAWAAPARQGGLGVRPSPWFTPLDGGRVRCELCPRGCQPGPGERGWCRVRENREGVLHTLVWGNPCAVHADPIEKKPFFHVLPGTGSFSLATAGCNFDCKFCQNFEISQARPEDTYNLDLPPEAAIAAALSAGCASVASTYVEPTIFCEYMMDLGRAARPRGLLNVMHSNGYINPGPLGQLCDWLDAACIDLKAFSERYYREVTEGSLQPVLDSLALLRARGVHVEIVTLLVPGRNDSPEEIRALSLWVRDTLGPDTPVHFTRFTPRYKLRSLPPTPLESLEAAWRTAREAGLTFVYLGNVPGHEAENTICPSCGTLLIRRRGFSSAVLALKDGRCASCGRRIPGIWGA